MKNATALLTYLLIAVAGCGFAWLAGSAGERWHGLPVMFLCAVLAFAINWIAAIPAIIGQTEHYYDLTGSATYVSVILLALALTGRADVPALIAAAMVLLWCLRLGFTLFRRVRRTGEDKRFRVLKTRPVSFLGAWTTQGLWVVLTSACAVAIITLPAIAMPGPLFWCGVLIWAAGLTIETVADAQKSRFRAVPGNEGRFIDSGLWAWSQHPNYFGEIMLWFGVAIAALPVLQGAAWLTLISPLFVYVLLTRVSGIPLLDQQARKRFGDDPAYADYVRRTAKLMLRPPLPSGAKRFDQDATPPA